MLAIASAIAGVDERFPLLGNMLRQSDHIYCNGAFNVCLAHLSSIKVQQPSLFIWLEGTVIFIVRRIKYMESLERASLECTE